MKIAVAGATGKSGRHLVARLCADGHQVVAHGRDPARLANLDGRAEGRLADFEDTAALRAALAGAEVVVNCAEARFARAILGALPSTCRRIIVTGTMRRFLAVPDEPGRFAADAETLIASCGRPGVVIHFGMIFGPPDDGNVERLLAVLRRWPRLVPLFVPLPGGGR
ncbi:MAG: NAD(P)-dependent oxidoreductase, partial [Alphaproteobacteria bacterium]|nr:NAD(P)-dependent oxidoreductase [Alphaproteobacteria bacterium]